VFEFPLDRETPNNAIKQIDRGIFRTHAPVIFCVYALLVPFTERHLANAIDALNKRKNKLKVETKKVEKSTRKNKSPQKKIPGGCLETYLN
jgi:hypothetical protein